MFGLGGLQSLRGLRPFPAGQRAVQSPPASRLDACPQQAVARPPRAGRRGIPLARARSDLT